MTTVGSIFSNPPSLPEVGLDALTGGAAMVLAPHPDDESLGCGGLIATACAAGQPPLLVMLTDGTGSHPKSRSHPAARLRAVREAETLAAAECLGLAADRVIFLRYSDTKAPNAGPALAVAVERVVGLVRAHNCRSLLAPWRHDPHCDHEAAATIAAAVAKVTVVPLWAYSVWGRTLPPEQEVEPTGAVRLAVQSWQAAKRKAIRCHRSQWDGLITDDPAGFQMRPEFMALFDTPDEIYLRPA